jgi:hypothetical protein
MATRAKKYPARKSTAPKSKAKKPGAKKPAAKKPAAKKLMSQKASSGGRLAMSVVPEPPKPKSNFCEDHGRLLRANRTCPVSTCRFHTKPMP